MEKLEVGEYVRIDNDFRLIALGIGEVIKINQDTIYVKMNFGLPFAFKIENISKHSKNLIDLIEVGDIVNGYRILEMVNSIYKKSKWILIYKNEREKYERWIYIKEYDGKIHTQDDIKTILTKEQYMQNCYKVEEEKK